MKAPLFIFLSLLFVTPQASAQEPATAVATSQSLLRKLKRQELTMRERDALAKFSTDALAQELRAPTERLAFWLNLYNAAAQLRYSQDPAQARNQDWLFTKRFFVVAGEELSLDDIEHGLLRRRSKWGGGYLPRFFPSRFERLLALETLEPRLHFALNCLAESCPPIEVYRPEDLERQLARVERWYLTQEVHYDATTKVAQLPRLFLWFHGDFEGRAGIQARLARLGLVPDDKHVEYRYKDYDWSTNAAKWAREE